MGKKLGRFHRYIYAAVDDVCKFHNYLDSLEGLSPGDLSRPLSQTEKVKLYKKMEEISETYPLNNGLKNKLDEAERLVWPQGRPNAR